MTKLFIIEPPYWFELENIQKVIQKKHNEYLFHNLKSNDLFLPNLLYPQCWKFIEKYIIAFLWPEDRISTSTKCQKAKGETNLQKSNMLVYLHELKWSLYNN